MDLLLSDEQQEIASTVASLLTDDLGNDTIDVRRTPTPINRETWARYGELGWFSLGLDEGLGGVGYGLAEEAILFREIGRQIPPGPFLASTLSARLAALGGQSQLAGSIAAGRTLVALAEPRNPDSAAGASISGSFDLFDGQDAEYVLIVTPRGAALVAAEDLGSLQPTACIDPSVHLATVDLSGAGAALYRPAGDDLLFERGTILIAATLAGVAEAVRDMATEYAKVREQFGRPIGVNQAVKHRCADMAILAEAAAAQVFFAAVSVDEGRGDAAFQASAARIVATDAALEGARANIQIHGGMGYTFECDANLFLKRSHVLDRQLGDKYAELDRLIDLPQAI